MVERFFFRGRMIFSPWWNDSRIAFLLLNAVEEEMTELQDHLKTEYI